MRFRSRLAVALALSFLLFACGVGTGYAIQHNLPDRSIAGMVSYFSPLRTPSPSDLQLNVLQEALGILEEDYMGELPSSEVLNRAAIRGVLEELGDPYTTLLDPELASMQEENLQGEFGGIGAHVEWDEDQTAVRIVEPFADSPAMAAGLQRGDYIVSVDGTPVSELGLPGSVARVRGPVDTDVVLGILRDEEQWEVSITRQIIAIQIVEHGQLGPAGAIGYLKLSTFNVKSAETVQQTLDELLDAEVQALILDLRDNGGGLLEQSVMIAGLFLGRKLVTEQHNEDGSITEHRAKQRPLVPPDMEVVVLVNASSASASEVVAGALQDHARGYLIGEPTFGKGSVQRTNVLSDESQLRVTVSQWYTPSGRSIEEQGLIPDLTIEMSMDDYESSLDPQLDAALGHLIPILGHDGQN